LNKIPDFNGDVIQKSYTVPVLVDFWAPWCAACKILSPALEILHDRHRGEWTLVKINVDKHPDISMQYDVSKIPSVKLFYEGKIIDEFSGAIPGHIIEECLQRILPGKSEILIKKAENLLHTQKKEEAIQALTTILDKEPTHKKARVLLASAIVLNDPYKAKNLITGIEPIGDIGEIAESVSILVHFLTSIKNLSDLPNSPAREPFFSAINALSFNQLKTAFNQLLDSIRADPSYLNGSAREVCSALFKYLGDDNELTKNYQRLLNAHLYP
jgi:putative thioredoxin